MSENQSDTATRIDHLQQVVAQQQQQLQQQQEQINQLERQHKSDIAALREELRAAFSANSAGGGARSTSSSSSLPAAAGATPQKSIQQENHPRAESDALQRDLDALRAQMQKTSSAFRRALEDNRASSSAEIINHLRDANTAAARNYHRAHLRALDVQLPAVELCVQRRIPLRPYQFAVLYHCIYYHQPRFPSVSLAEVLRACRMNLEIQNENQNEQQEDEDADDSQRPCAEAWCAAAEAVFILRRPLVLSNRQSFSYFNCYIAAARLSPQCGIAWEGAAWSQDPFVIVEDENIVDGGQQEQQEREQHRQQDPRRRIERTYDRHAAVMKALELNFSSAAAWWSCGYLCPRDGTIDVCGRRFTKHDCYAEAIRVNDTYAVAFLNLGVVAFSETGFANNDNNNNNQPNQNQDATAASSSSSSPPNTTAGDRRRTIFVRDFGRVSRIELFKKAIEIDSNPDLMTEAWRRLGNALTAAREFRQEEQQNQNRDGNNNYNYNNEEEEFFTNGSNGEVTIAGRRYDGEQCLARARAVGDAWGQMKMRLANERI